MRALVFALAALAVVFVAVPAFAQEDDPAFAPCAVCHSLVKGKNGIGPSLHGVVGARKASASGYAYSDALKKKGGLWTPPELDAYLTDSAAFVQGTKMAYHQKDAAKRAAAIAVLKRTD